MSRQMVLNQTHIPIQCVKCSLADPDHWDPAPALDQDPDPALDLKLGSESGSSQILIGMLYAMNFCIPLKKNPESKYTINEYKGIKKLKRIYIIKSRFNDKYPESLESK